MYPSRQVRNSVLMHPRRESFGWRDPVYFWRPTSLNTPREFRAWTGRQKTERQNAFALLLFGSSVGSLAEKRDMELRLES